MEVHMLEKTTLKNKGELMICTIWCSYSYSERMDKEHF